MNLRDLKYCRFAQVAERCCISQSMLSTQINKMVEGLETLRQMVRAGTGITFIPQIAIYETEPGICYLPFTDPVPSRNIGLLWRKTSVRTKLIRHLIKLIKTTVGI